MPWPEFVGVINPAIRLRSALSPCDLGKSLKVSHLILGFLMRWHLGLLGQLRLPVYFRSLDRLSEFKHQAGVWMLTRQVGPGTGAQPQESWPFAASPGPFWGWWADTKFPSCLPSGHCNTGPAKDGLSSDNALAVGTCGAPPGSALQPVVRQGPGESLALQAAGPLAEGPVLPETHREISVCPGTGGCPCFERQGRLLWGCLAP